MKNLFYLLLVFVFTSCGVSSVVVNVQRPADISVPQNIQKVIVANRSTPEKGNLANNIIEGLITGEGIGSDKKGSEYCVMGLVEMLAGSDRYELKNSGEVDLKGTGTSTFPPLLSWDEVNSLCDSYGADAIIVLATFDSDSRLFEGKSVVRTKKIKGVKVREVKYPVTLIMEITSGWRIYDATNKKVVDVNTFTEVQEYKEWGSSYEDARSHLPSQRRALKGAGNFSGKQYGFRISPIWVRVNRSYYSGKGDELKSAKQMVKRGDWDSAIKIWKGLIDNLDVKIARRAYFNLALAAEIKGKLDVAIEYAEKSRNLGEKKASAYINTLRLRKQDEAKLKQQLNN